MLNPDGVVVGNYRCSLAGRDLNRNYRTLLRDSFPSVWHTRNMVEKWDLIKMLKKDHFRLCLELLHQTQAISPLNCLRLSNTFQIWWLPNSQCMHNFFYSFFFFLIVNVDRICFLIEISATPHFPQITGWKRCSSLLWFSWPQPKKQCLYVWLQKQRWHYTETSRESLSTNDEQEC